MSDASGDEGRSASDGRFQGLLEALGDPVYALDPDGTFAYVNDRFVEVSGYDREWLLGTHASDLTPGSDIGEATARARRTVDELVADTDRERATVEAELQTADGEVIPVEVNVSVLTEDGAFAGVTGVVRDISERQARQRELQQYKTLVENVGDPMYVLDTEGYIEMANEALAASLGAPHEEVIGSHVTRFMPEEDVATGVEIIADLLQSPERTKQAWEMEVIHPDGSRSEHETMTAVITDEDGTFAGSVGVVRDITERKAREEALREQNERLDEFARVVAHDLRNPLHVAGLRLELGRETGEDEHFQAVEDAHDRMRSLIDDLLTLAREGIDLDDREPVSLEQVARDAWATSPTADADLAVAADVRLPAASAQLSQALENLFRNAVEHGGEDVTVEVGRLDGDGFYVADDGEGIDPEIRGDIFEAGVSGDDDTGLGLEIVERIVDAHGWDIDVTASADGGARFEVTGVDLDGA